MSEETYEAVEVALRAHVLDEGNGAYLTCWQLSAAGVIPETPDVVRYVYASSDSAPHELLGMLELARRRTDRLTIYNTDIR